MVRFVLGAKSGVSGNSSLPIPEPKIIEILGVIVVVLTFRVKDDWTTQKNLKKYAKDTITNIRTSTKRTE